MKKPAFIQPLFTTIRRISRRTWIVTGVIVVIIIGALFFISRGKNTDQDQALYIIDTVDRGDVSSGISASGKIVAAQKLNLNVYTQTARITTASITNGQPVKKGQTLFAFDASDLSVDITNNRLNVTDAELALEEQKIKQGSDSLTIQTLGQKVTSLTNAAEQAEHDLVVLRRNYLSAGLEAFPDTRRMSQTSQTSPTISGYYTGNNEGTYRVEVYASGTESGLSFQVRGLESYTGAVITNNAVLLGELGLRISFNDQVRAGNVWEIPIPNTQGINYVTAHESYEKNTQNKQQELTQLRTNLEQAVRDLESGVRADTPTYRNVDLERAHVALERAKVSLSKSYEQARERRVTAPFDGIVEGVENVVIGATPTRDSTNTINFGTLISNDFLATFNLSAADVARITRGQQVLVTVTSFPGSRPFGATITEISSLPASSSTPQYEVKALLDYRHDTAPIQLREGMIADIEILQEMQSNVLRVPTSAIEYKDGKPTVLSVSQLSSEQKNQLEKTGIIQSLDGTTFTTYRTPVTLGLVGQYYAEIVSGLNEGDPILITSTVGANSAVQTPAFRGFPGAGGVGSGGSMMRQTGGTGNSGRNTP